MSLNWNDVPEIFQPFKDKISSTLKSSIEIDIQPEQDLTLWQSKIGGKPYLPLGQSYPESLEGEALQLLAQINFAELPENEVYPKSGLLQFFINPNDDLYGLNFDDQQKQDGFRVIYIEDVTQDIAQLEQTFPTLDSENTLSPIEGQYAIRFQSDQQYIGLSEFNFSEKVTDVSTMEDDVAEEFWDEYGETFSANGHRLSGYAFFTQTDPREYNEKIQDYVLLLQIDTDDSDGKNIMWGDSGVGNFFIHPEDLKKRDFSKVLYNWDCY